MPATRDPGFYGTNDSTYYLSQSGRAWIVQSDDLGPDDPVPIDPERIPDGAVPVDELMTPDEAIGHMRRIESVSDERLIEN
jgi:hypothetical protein